jgi:hypothetical protein
MHVEHFLYYWMTRLCKTQCCCSGMFIPDLYPDPTFQFISDPDPVWVSQMGDISEGVADTLWPAKKIYKKSMRKKLHTRSIAKFPKEVRCILWTSNWAIFTLCRVRVRHNFYRSGQPENSSICSDSDSQDWLKVHKIENFFDCDFGICVISLLVMPKY